MESSYQSQFAGIVRRTGTAARAHLCDGDASEAVVWDPATEITVRLSLRGDEVWLLAGSGLLIRFVAASDGEFDHEGIDRVIGLVLRGEAVEHFGVAALDGQDAPPSIPTGYRVGEPQGYSGGLPAGQARFEARIAGPLARAHLDLTE